MLAVAAGLATTAAGAQPADVAAPEPPAPPEPDPGPLAKMMAVEIHAFVSQGYIKSSKNNFLGRSKRGTFDLSEVGINFTQSPTERLRAGVQLFARRIGNAGDYRARVDWFYLDYTFTDWLGLRAGRTKVPFGLYNEVNDVDAGRVPVLLPQSVYPVLNRDFLLAQTGLEVYGYVRMGALGALEYRLYGGTLTLEAPAAPPPLVLLELEVPYLLGGRLLWETPVEGLRAGGSYQALRINTHYALPVAGMPPLRLDLEIPFRLWLASAEYAAHDLLLAAEYGRWRADVETTGMPTVKVVNERFYVMAAYRVTPWLTPGLYYAKLVPDVTKRSGRENYRHDLAATLRFDVNRFWIIKLEGHFMRGTAEVEPGLNDGVPAASLTRDWVLFLAKTTAYF